MRIAIVEDDKRDMEQLRGVVDAYAADRALPVEIDMFSSGPDFLCGFAPGKYELIFFDNYIGDGLGIDFARQARAQDEAAEFVFVSMSPEFAVSGYDVRALHYLLKPATHEGIARVFDRFRFRRCAPTPETQLLEVMQNQRPVLIPIPSIRYIEVAHRTSLIHAEEDVPVYMTLENLMERLPPEEFVRTHKSYAVRLGEIQSMGQNEFRLKGGGTIPIGRSYQNASKIAFLKYLVKHKEK